MDKTIKLYDREPYGTTFSANVIAVEMTEKGYAVILDQTLFFPEEGGQSPDHGQLCGYPVTDVQIKDGVITHYLKKHKNKVVDVIIDLNSDVTEDLNTDMTEDLNTDMTEDLNSDVTVDLKPGTRIEGKIDWAERFSNMQNHTGEHILSGIIHRMFGYDNVGFHLSRQSVTMDMNGAIIPEQLIVIEDTANQAVYDNVTVTAEYQTKEALRDLNYRSKIEIEGDVRIVTIPGYDVCACCAPHVKKTGEIGLIKILRAENYKGGTRLTIACGSRALQEVRLRQNQIMEISQYLSAKPEMVLDEIQRIQDDNAKLKTTITDLKTKQIEEKAKTVPDGQKDLCIFEDELDSNVHRTYVNCLLSKCSGTCAVFAGNDTDGYRYIIGSKTDARPVNQILKDGFGAKGGGKPEMVQGSLKAEKEAVITALSEVMQLNR